MKILHNKYYISIKIIICITIIYFNGGLRINIPSGSRYNLKKLNKYFIIKR